MAEKSVGRKATRRRSIGPGRIQALGEIVNHSSEDGVVASYRRTLCQEGAKLQVALPSEASRTDPPAAEAPPIPGEVALGAVLGAVDAEIPSIQVLEWWRRRESNSGLWALDGLSERTFRDILGSRDVP
jgi:hypothetical protein